MSATLLPPTDVEPDGAAWRRDRRPVIVAAAVVAIALLVCWVLRWWGPINPAVTATASVGVGVDGGVSVDGAVAGDAGIVIELANGSLADAEVVEVRARMRAPSTTPFEPVPMRSSPEQTLVAGRSRTQVKAGVPTCPDGVRGMAGSYDVEVDLRTASRRVMSVPASTTGSVSCHQAPPPQGTPSSDSAAADEIAQAFVTVHDTTVDSAKREALIDDTRGVTDAYQAAISGQYGSIVEGVRATVERVEFDRPDHAWVHYALSPIAPGGSMAREGEAVLVDGRWKVTRSTVCNDLALAMAPCPWDPLESTCRHASLSIL